jgi:hypothetical protein
MRTRSKFEIERLSEAREGRIEEALFERLREVRPFTRRAVPEPTAPERWKLAVAFVMTGAAAAFVGAFGLHLLKPASPVVAFPAVVGLAPYHIVASRTRSHMRIGESELYLSPESEASIDGDDDARGILVRLERGAVECEVSPRRGRPPFVVQAGAVSIRVVGTHFRVSLSDTNASVDVDRGTVEVKAIGAPASELHAGDHWVWPPSLDVGPPAASGSALSPRLAPDRGGGAATTLAMDRYNRAVEIEGRSPGEALSIYRSLAQASGPWAMNALFAWGRLAADRGDRGEAVRVLSDYLARYPEGPNAEDARQLLVRLR